MDFKHLKKFKKILVTGPQRSGTTFAANIIASDLGYLYVDERHIGIRSLTALFTKLIDNNSCVIHGPCFCPVCHWIDTPDTAIIILRRSVEDIIASQLRIEWTHEESELLYCFSDEGPISKVRYNLFDKYQKKLLKIPYFEIEYEELASHPLWVDKDNRKNFHPRQYKVEYKYSKINYAYLI